MNQGQLYICRSSPCQYKRQTGHICLTLQVDRYLKSSPFQGVDKLCIGLWDSASNELVETVATDWVVEWTSGYQRHPQLALVIVSDWHFIDGVEYPKWIMALPSLIHRYKSPSNIIPIKCQWSQCSENDDSGSSAVYNIGITCRRLSRVLSNLVNRKDSLSELDKVNELMSLLYIASYCIDGIEIPLSQIVPPLISQLWDLMKSQQLSSSNQPHLCDLITVSVTLLIGSRLGKIARGPLLTILSTSPILISPDSVDTVKDEESQPITVNRRDRRDDDTTIGKDSSRRESVMREFIREISKVVVDRVGWSEDWRRIACQLVTLEVDEIQQRELFIGLLKSES